MTLLCDFELNNDMSYCVWPCGFVCVCPSGQACTTFMPHFHGYVVAVVLMDGQTVGHAVRTINGAKRFAPLELKSE